VTEEFQTSVRVIHDLERAIRVWELLRDDAQQVVNEASAPSETRGDSVATNPAVISARSLIATCNTSILAANERIDELAIGD
jgi:hypothetical protein